MKAIDTILYYYYAMIYYIPVQKERERVTEWSKSDWKGYVEPVLQVILKRDFIHHHSPWPGMVSFLVPSTAWFGMGAA